MHIFCKQFLQINNSTKNMLLSTQPFVSHMYTFCFCQIQTKNIWGLYLQHCISYFKHELLFFYNVAIELMVVYRGLDNLYTVAPLNECHFIIYQTSFLILTIFCFDIIFQTSASYCKER